jgi:polysaccharide biosynthesis protein PslG
MRTLAMLCALLSMLSLAPAAHAEDVVADLSAPGVQFKGTWATSASGSGYRYRVAGDGSSSVTWPAPSGTFEVLARWTSGPNRASNATYVVNHTGGSAPVRVNQRTNGGAWQSLGSFTFASGNTVQLTDKADGVVIADAIRFVPSQSASSDARYFEQTGFRIDRDAFWDFFQKRGGVRTFGYPVSRAFLFAGCQTQLFQRLAMQQCDGQSVGTLNLLEDGLLPYTHFNGSTVPAPDATLIDAAPVVSDPNFSSKAIDFVRANAPDSLDGEPVNFFATFQNTVSLGDAFPQGNADASLLPLLNLQLWGLPTSKPAVDPNNHEFIYLRFQRGVMHYDRGCKCTQALLLGDFFKSMLTGDRLPVDLAAEAGNSSLLRAVNHPPRATSFADAFTAQAPVPAAPAPAPSVAPAPAASVAPASATGPITVASPDFGMSLFLWGHPTTTARDLKLVTDAGFHWQKTLFQWRQIEGACKGCFDWSESDRVVKATTAAGLQIIARLDFQPSWARKDGATNGPPDNYQDYADFVSAFVSRYKGGSPNGRVGAIEIWNEVNLDREWGGQRIDQRQAADYVRLLGLAYSAAKAADPSVTVITAGLSPTGVTDSHSADDVQYLQWLYDAGMQGKYDVLGAHGNTQAPEVDVALDSLASFPHASFYFRRVEQLREVMVRNGDADKRVWLLEFGWTSDTVHPSYAWFAVSEAKKGSNILKAFQYARQHWQPWIGVMTLWTVPDPSWTPDREEYWWAITNPDGTPRPAYAELVQAHLTASILSVNGS